MGSETLVHGQGRIHAWKPYSDAERIELYRRVWGPSWGPASIGIVTGVPNKRHEAIQQHMIVVETIAGKLLQRGQNASIEKGDLLQVGYAEMIGTIDRPPVGELPLDKRIARNCKTIMLRFITGRLREWRYFQQGKHEVIRDTHEALGLPITAKYIRAREEAAEEEEAVEEALAESTSYESASPETGEEEFIYLDWLRGFDSVFRNIRAHHIEEIQECDLPEELAEIAHRIGYQLKELAFPHWRGPNDRAPWLECLRRPSPEQRRAYLEAWAPLWVRDRYVLKRMPPHHPRYRGLFWDGGRGLFNEAYEAPPALLHEAREARPATVADTVTPTARFSIVRSRVPVY